MSASILLVGNSHIHAVKRAREADETPDVHFYDLDHERRAGTDRDPIAVLRAHFVKGKFGVVDTLGMAIRGNLYNVFGLFNHPTPYYLAGADPKGQFVPLDMMRGLMKDHLAVNLEFATTIARAIPARRKILMAAPPPIGDEVFLTAHLGTMAAKAKTGFSPPALRRKLYDLQCEIQREQARDLGLEFMAAPAQAFGSDGFMRPTYFRNDTAHGNDDYGRLVLAQLVAQRTLCV